MKEVRIFIFDAKDGDKLSRDVYGDNGHVLVKKNTVLDYDIIANISGHHILEVDIYDREELEQSSAEGSFDKVLNDSEGYYDKVRKSEQFQKFRADYTEDVNSIKNSLNAIVYNNEVIDTDKLMEGTNKILSENKNSLQLFDMLHSIRKFDDMTYVHCVNVSLICSIIGQWLNFSEEDRKVLTLCGILHDIGKVKIPPEILNKPDRLSSNEYLIMKSHTSLGYRILKDQNIDNRIKEACLLHHEKCDGTGYPFNLKSDRIPDFAKIVAIADVYDAMTAARVYRGAMCPFEVIKMMNVDAFTKFDPKFLLPFLKNVASSYINNDVRLSDGRIAKVILINDNDLSQPVVKCEDEFIDLSKTRELSISAII